MCQNSRRKQDCTTSYNKMVWPLMILGNPPFCPSPRAWLRKQDHKQRPAPDGNAASRAGIPGGPPPCQEIALLAGHRGLLCWSPEGKNSDASNGCLFHWHLYLVKQPNSYKGEPWLNTSGKDGIILNQHSDLKW